MRQRLRERVVVAVLRTTAYLRYDWRNSIGHVRHGLHTGIPLCCVTFFAFDWAPWMTLHKIPHPHLLDLRIAGLAQPHAADRRRPPPRHIPCPDCLAAQRFVETHECGPACSTAERAPTADGVAVEPPVVLS